MIFKQKINKKRMTTKLFTEIENFVEKEKCDELIKICEKKNETQLKFDNQFRIKFIDIIIQEMIQKIYNIKIKSILNSDFYINNTFSYVRYNNDGLVLSHHDKYVNNNAQFTILIYLNDEYDEGETYIYNENQTKKTTIPKKIGKCIIFDGSKLLHGCNQVKGIKNILIGSLIKI
jgi:hypothetical protein